MDPGVFIHGYIECHFAIYLFYADFNPPDPVRAQVGTLHNVHVGEKG